MRKYRIIILCAMVIIIFLTIGFLMKEKRLVYNYVDTYYVFDYFTISKFASFLLAFLGLLWFGYKKIK
jgi:hypothetical protein